MSEKLPQEVQQAKEKGDEVLQLTGEDERCYFFKKPGRKDMDRYLSMAAKGKVSAAVQNLVAELAIKPTAEELRKEFVDSPGRMVALSNALQQAVGLNEDFTAKKL